ncbi:MULTISPECIES: tripartite tricarboxylate transporter substrate binding protein [Vibrio]|uniref:Tripartite tricarboxylate transporter substrate binding protein n=1 Tax=Vibrio ostreae TaxID=2841925 RepID=A0A975YPM6_9VIBR|nr:MULTISPECIES: tripartite tricarboxylate transporter substrate binding protein [Vibrio]QXO18874.1 tripartite tricarboxylate transporter substrate binding protein [Vibrio ostreae]WGY46796.1 tripartite tricarboxylate transporter substrate binding protein [Vibrio sp. ABG19]
MRKLTFAFAHLLIAATTLGAMSSASANDYPPRTVNMVAPAGAGGGWDLTIRTVAKTLKDENLVSSNLPVINRPGGGGAVNLTFMQTQKGKGDLISVYSPPILLTNLTGMTPYSYKDTTPLARLISDYAAFVVPQDSPYTSINQVMDALKKDPKSIKIGGISTAGSMDHIQFLLVAKAAGVKDLRDIDYVSFQDGGVVAQVLGGHIDLISTGLGDVAGLLESGKLRALAQTADKRIGEGAMAKIPTVKEQGIDVTFENWRGLFGPKDMPKEAVDYWRDALQKMTETAEWKAAMKRNGWEAAYQDQAEFEQFLSATNEQYKTLIQEVFR